MFVSRRCLLAALAGLLSFAPAAVAQETTEARTPPLRALIVDGQNNHTDWPLITVMMKQYLEETGLFTVDVARTRFTWRGDKRAEWLPRAGAGESVDLPQPKADPRFNPTWSDYDVVVSNFGNTAAPWPEETKTAFEEYVKNGGGFVSVHAADNSFGDWPEYNRMIGVGGWGGRSADAGVHLYYSDAGELVRDDSGKGGTGTHGARLPFPIVKRAEHPIVAGLPDRWQHAADECYARLRGPAESLTVLATGKDQTDNAPTGKHEPMLMTIRYGEGRVFHTTLGHSAEACESVDFILTLNRGAQWAATGEVTLPVPQDFPTADATSSRPFELDELIEAR
ncbi:ThuA domain-containing protein [Alienimonas californiensis]|uniref:Trehalose utilization n=1 Tax=Alienimonas californiensis TaxID=2527989 RepID=A0A517PCK3_9PLAN|nr:ThuA domain-containing protein [Alienimonas californiensis]QDT17092.1 Trehalose utilization [Alienimonas californiensis]